MLEHLTQFILGATTSVWGYVGLVPLILADALFPPVPSESVVISMASLLVHGHPGLLVVLFLVAAGAAWCGDNIAYAVGGSHWLHDHPLLRRPRPAAALAWSRRELLERGATLIIVGRFLPGVRVAITLACGLSGYPRGRYRWVVVVSSSLWALYCILIGSVAGAWFAGHQLVGVAVAIAVGMVLGPLVDQLLRRRVLHGSGGPWQVR